jgi:hypothetical protein
VARGKSGQTVTKVFGSEAAGVAQIAPPKAALGEIEPNACRAVVRSSGKFVAAGRATLRRRVRIGCQFTN